jgi:uncharacterized membrane protein YeaQ/YmgE (transglycosylase-associated protein family)
MQDSFSQPDAEHSVMDLIVDQLEELVVTIIEEIRERPGIAAAILAAIVGAVVGSVLAAGAGRRRSPVERVVDRARGAADTLDLAGLGVKLLQNPVIRGYIWSAIESQVKKRISR